MTREEEIDKAGREWFSQVKKYDADVATAFLAGAQWADRHPHWISVSDKLPEDDSEVACITADGELYTDRYIRGTRYGNIWRKTEKKPIKWLPLPKKGGEQ